MTDDAIQAGIRATRDALAAENEYDAYKMLAAVRARSVAKGRQVVSLPPRSVTAGPPPEAVFPAGVRAPAEDSILREIHATREAFAAAHGYDVRAMGEALRRSAAEQGRPAVPLPAPVTPPEAA
ncbi:MAG TPA: hypothetical protein VD866_13990 [Urbifossiella sp.]|nr:hypothetical protein [Urbifossiella sp.]